MRLTTLIDIYTPRNKNPLQLQSKDNGLVFHETMSCPRFQKNSSSMVFDDISARRTRSRGTWVGLLVKSPTLHLSSGHDLRLMRQSPTLGSTLGMQPAWEFCLLFLCPFPNPSHTCSVSVSLRNNKKYFLKIKYDK